MERETPARSVSDTQTTARRDWADASVYTIGHSTRTQAELIALLRHYRIAALADVRPIPRSRHNPQFNQEVLATALPAAGIAYAHLPRLGGRRRGYLYFLALGEHLRALGLLGAAGSQTHPLK